MIYHYLVEYCQPPQSTSAKLKFFYKYPRSIYTGKKLIRMEGVDNTVIEQMAHKTEDFSGREIFKMVVGWHDAAFAKSDPVLTPELMQNVLDRFVD